MTDIKQAKFQEIKKKKSYIDADTVQLEYCDSDVTVCLLFWNMPIVQDRDVKFPYKRYRYYLQIDYLDRF